MKWYAVLCSFSLLLLAQACTASTDVDKAKLKARPVGCVNGKILPCQCSNGTMSQQQCNAFGRYEPCDCPAAAVGGAGTSG